MNDRIKEIERQCWQSTDSEPYALFDVKKFAQLIVKECGNWIVENAGAMEHLGPDYFAKAMTKDFGVEE